MRLGFLNVFSAEGTRIRGCPPPAPTLAHKKCGYIESVGGSRHHIYSISTPASAHYYK